MLKACKGSQKTGAKGPDQPLRFSMGSSSSKTLAAQPHSLQTGGGGPAHFANQAEPKPYRHQIATCYFLAATVGHGPQTP